MEKVTLKKPYTNKEYADLAVYCNKNDCHIENKGFYLEAVKNPEYIPTYAEKRAAEYPAIGDQLDMIYWDKINGTHNWEETITAIKEKYPKDEGKA